MFADDVLRIMHERWPHILLEVHAGHIICWEDGPSPRDVADALSDAGMPVDFDPEMNDIVPVDGGIEEGVVNFFRELRPFTAALALIRENASSADITQRVDCGTYPLQGLAAENSAEQAAAVIIVDWFNDLSHQEDGHIAFHVADATTQLGGLSAIRDIVAGIEREPRRHARRQ